MCRIAIAIKMGFIYLTPYFSTDHKTFLLTSLRESSILKTSEATGLPETVMTANQLFESIQQRGQKHLSLKQTQYLRNLLLQTDDVQYTNFGRTEYNWMHDGAVRSMTVNPSTGCGFISEVK